VAETIAAVSEMLRGHGFTGEVRALPVDVPTAAAAAGQVAGGVAPVGHPAPVTTFIDRWLDRHPHVWAGAGQPHLVFRTTFAELAKVTGGVPAEVGTE
jgi:prolyl-tRNA editing enzyme YbaK/EbsC (Cys-tRNA(Pro) deacylase)